MNRCVIKSPIGNIGIGEDDGKILTIQFTDNTLLAPNTDILINAANELSEYFEGRRKGFDMVLGPLGTDFQHKVWNKLLKIPYGKTITYLELAKQLGDPNTIRAAASANGKNPLAIVIPCHRVIGSNGSMIGYAGGLDRKQALLQLEGASVMSQMNIF